MNKLHRAFFQRVSVRQNRLRLCSSAAQEQSSSTSPEQEIIIPDRIPRGPTDILKALASTVGIDYTAPHFRYHDDPWLIPYKNNTKKDYALSKESGRNAARFILNKHPDLFTHNRINMEPPITAFQPRNNYNESNVTIELLTNLVANFQVEDSIEVRSLLLGKRKTIPKDLEQDFLELIAFHNEIEAPTEKDSETRGMVFNLSENEWKSGGVAEQVYSKGGKATPGRRIALLLGLAKYNENQRVLQMYEECVANNDFLPVEVYNAVIKADSIAKYKVNNVGFEKVKESITDMLGEMKKKKVKPNIDTCVSIMRVLEETSMKNYGTSCSFALSVMSEFREAGIEPSLAVYKSLLDIYVKKVHSEKSLILKDILIELEGKNMWPAKSLEDFYFFSKAMKVAQMLNNTSLAFQVHELLLTGDNIKLHGDWITVSFYYRDFITTVLRNDEFSTAIELYNQITPHIWSPDGNLFKQLLQEMHIQNGLNYMGKVYDDMRATDFGGSRMEDQYEITKQLLEVLVANDPSKSEYNNLGEVWLNIAKKSFNDLVVGKFRKEYMLRVNKSAAAICDHVIAVVLREGDFEAACEVLDFCRVERSVMIGSLSEETLKTLFRYCLELRETERGIQVVDYAADTASPLALKLGTEIAATGELSLGQKDYLNKLFATETKWKPV